MSADKPVSLAERVHVYHCTCLRLPGIPDASRDSRCIALEAEAKALERQVAAWKTDSEKMLGLIAQRDERVEALVEVLQSAPKPGIQHRHEGQKYDCPYCAYRTWYDGIRATALADEPQKEA